MTVRWTVRTGSPQGKQHCQFVSHVCACVPVLRLCTVCVFYVVTFFPPFLPPMLTSEYLDRCVMDLGVDGFGSEQCREAQKDPEGKAS